jgi:phosphoglycerate dehydrogenase-like enzyme
VAGIRLLTPDIGGVADALIEAPVLITYQWRDEFLTTALRWVQSISAGTEQFPIVRMAGAGVVLTSARGVHGPQVAEHALALLLSMTRGVGRSTLQRAGRSWDWPEVTEIGGLTLGVLGLGAIGEAVAERARALGMRVIGVKRVVDGYQGAADEVLPAERLLDLFTAADAVVVALPGGDDTRNLVGARELDALGGGWLVNVGRGTVVDEVALVEALTGGSLRGAGLDVFESEPLPADSPLWDLPSVVMTPHIAGASPHYGARLADLFRINLDAFHGHGDWLGRVV